MNARRCGCGLMLAALLASPAAGRPLDHPGYVDLAFVDQYAGDDVKVEVNISKALLQLAAKLSEASQPQAAPLLQKLEQITVRVIETANRDQASLRTWVDGIVRDLRAKGWEPVASVREKGEEAVNVLMLATAEQVSGILVTVIDANKEAVFVNVVGDIDLAALAEIGKMMNVPGLGNVGKINTQKHPWELYAPKESPQVKELEQRAKELEEQVKELQQRQGEPNPVPETAPATP